MRRIESIIILPGALILTSLVTDEAEGVSTEPRCAIIIVSDLDGFNAEELEKADQFYQYLLDQDYSDEDIVFLTEDGRTGCDDDPTVSNIENAFFWLENTSQPSSQPVIYVCDHEKLISGIVNFRFADGNISANTIDGWLDSTRYQDLTLILNGNRSALAGPVLSSSARDIFCSMRSYQSFDQDLFNITRGLTDPSADLNFDGEVSYYEAFRKEELLLTGTGQDPVLY